jgi:hypothetical protein
MIKFLFLIKKFKHACDEAMCSVIRIREVSNTCYMLSLLNFFSFSPHPLFLLLFTPLFIFFSLHNRFLLFFTLHTNTHCFIFISSLNHFYLNSLSLLDSTNDILLGDNTNEVFFWDSTDEICNFLVLIILVMWMFHCYQF